MFRCSVKWRICLFETKPRDERGLMILFDEKVDFG